MNAVRTRIEKAVDLGCKAVCITVGTAYQPAAAGRLPDPPSPSRRASGPRLERHRPIAARDPRPGPFE